MNEHPAARIAAAAVPVNRHGVRPEASQPGRSRLSGELLPLRNKSGARCQPLLAEQRDELLARQWLAEEIALHLLAPEQPQNPGLFLRSRRAGDLLKIALAALMLPLGWKLMRKANPEPS